LFGYFAYLYTLNKQPRHLLFSAFGLGFAFITRLTSLLISPALLLLVSPAFITDLISGNFENSEQRSVSVFISFLAICLSQPLYNYHRFGSIFETGYSLIAMKTGIDFFSGTPLLTGLSGLLISPGRAFLLFSGCHSFPVSFRSFMKKHRTLGFAFLLIIVSISCSSQKISTGTETGLGGPLSACLNAIFYHSYSGVPRFNSMAKKTSHEMALYFIFTVSLIIQLLAVSIYFQIYFFHLAMNKM